jgi:hypothetical protein
MPSNNQKGTMSAEHFLHERLRRVLRCFSDENDWICRGHIPLCSGESGHTRKPDSGSEEWRKECENEQSLPPTYALRSTFPSLPNQRNSLIDHVNPQELHLSAHAKTRYPDRRPMRRSGLVSRKHHRIHRSRLAISPAQGPGYDNHSPRDAKIEGR